MTKHASLSSLFDSRSDLSAASLGAETHGHLSEPELSAWAEHATITAGGQSHFGRLGTLAFWTIIAGLLIARFFVIDPAKLRPESASAPVSVSSATPSKI
jgi:hypothetical protein